jgi:hypothetical protein
METTPGSIADIILVGLVAAGGRVVSRNADQHGCYGFVVVAMPDGTEVKINIELD